MRFLWFSLLPLFLLVACRDPLPENDLLPDQVEEPTGTLTGTLVDSTFDPVPEAMLILCGHVAGKEVCNQAFSGMDGSFFYEELLTGYTHLQIMPYAATEATGRFYAGASLAIALPEPPADTDLGQIMLPLVDETALLNVAQGGLVEVANLGLSFAPASVSFPGLEDEGPVGVVQVPGPDVPFAVAGEVVAAYAFYPYNTRVNPPCEVTLPIPEEWQGSELAVWHNGTDVGGLLEVAATPVDTSLHIALTEFSWVVVTAP